MGLCPQRASLEVNANRPEADFRTTGTAHTLPVTHYTTGRKWVAMGVDEGIALHGQIRK